MPVVKTALVSASALLGVIGGLAARYAAQRSRIERSWLAQAEPKLASIGEVDRLSILPLVERLVRSDELKGEAGVCYLVRAGRTTLLFDSGLNMRGEVRSALVHNADILGVDLTRLDGMVISHLHVDHVGGLRNQLGSTFAFSAEPLEARGLPAYVPTRMSQRRAAVLLTTGPRVIAAGVAVLPPLPSMLFWLGPVAEQAIVVNVCGFGLVLVSGCGHPGIERMLAVAERVLDVPVKGVVGGLHLPVHPLGTPLLPQAVMGNPNWPWRPIGERDVADAIRELQDRAPHVVAVSGHDSTPRAYGAFAQVFGDRYRTLRVGEELVVSAEGVRFMPVGLPTERRASRAGVEG
jgi:7,8-dihydropterin-6-yl-methyl-4-(beta-D-ribofuranosyl)aminobenzene 5'-phosphate synthase